MKYVLFLVAFHLTRYINSVGSSDGRSGSSSKSVVLSLVSVIVLSVVKTSLLSLYSAWLVTFLTVRRLVSFLSD
jgi:hypothetical protein